MPFFQDVSGLGTDRAVAERALGTLRQPYISMEQLQSAVEALQRSEFGRRVTREVLGRIAPEWSFSSMGVTPENVLPLQRLLRRGALADHIAVAVADASAEHFNPFEFTFGKKNTWEK